MIGEPHAAPIRQLSEGQHRPLRQERPGPGGVARRSGLTPGRGARMLLDEMVEIESGKATDRLAAARASQQAKGNPFERPSPLL